MIYEFDVETNVVKILVARLPLFLAPAPLKETFLPIRFAPLPTKGNFSSHSFCPPAPLTVHLSIRDE